MAQVGGGVADRVRGVGAWRRHSARGTRKPWRLYECAHCDLCVSRILVIVSVGRR